jgi:hypothetical protein
MDGNTVVLTLYNEVFDVNGARALGDGNEFVIVVSNEQYSTSLALKHGESGEVELPRGVFSVDVDPDSLSPLADGDYQYIALVGPDGLADTLTLDLTNVDAANATVINRVSGAPTVGGGVLEVATYVISNGILMQADQANAFQINVQGTRIVTVEPLSDLGGGNADALGEGADDAAAEAAPAVEEAAPAAEGEAPAEQAAEAGQAETEAEALESPLSLQEELAAYETLEELETDGTTQNAVETEPADGVGGEGQPAEPAAPEAPAEPAEQPGLGEIGAIVPLVDIEQPYVAAQGIFQGGSYRFATGRGNFTVTEQLAENGGYALDGIFEYNESTTRLFGAAGASSLGVYVSDDVGAVALVINRAVPIEAPVVLPEVGAGLASVGGVAGSIEPLAEVLLDDEDVAAGSAFLPDHIQYIFGYPDGSVRPDSTITRAEMAAMIFRLLADDAKNANYQIPFSDVEQGKWYSQAIAYLASQGIVAGYPDGTFRPDQPITRAEFAKMVAGFDELDETSRNSFSDTEGHWAAGFISSAAAKGWVSGYPDGTFQPEGGTTRAEAVTVINRMLNRQVALGDIPDWAPIYTDLTEAHWAYTAIIEASVTHSFEYKDDGFEIWGE